MPTTQEFANLETHAAFYGGAFEVGGHIEFSIEVTRKAQSNHSYGVPVITIDDKNPYKIDAFAKRAGIILPHNSKRLRIKREIAVQFTEVISAYTPSRQEVILAFENWRDGDSREERLQIAMEHRTSEQVQLKPKDYEELTRNAQFLAGVYESRGNLYTRIKDINRLVRIQFASKNHPLLEAIRGVYPGSLWPTYGRGWNLEIAGENSMRLLGDVKPHLLDYQHDWQEYIDQAR